MDAIWMLGFARNIVLCRVDEASIEKKSWLACATVAGDVALTSNLSRTARAVELMFRGDFSLLCWCCATAIIVFCMCCDTLCMGTGVSKRCVLQYCVAILLCCAIQLVQIAVAWLRQGCWNGTSSAVEPCDSVCGLQVSVGRSHWNCYIMDAICMLHAVFSGKQGVRCGEKLARLRDGCGRDVALTSNLSRTARAVETDVSRWLFLFFVDAVPLLLLCFACVATRCAWELVYRSNVFYSIVLQFFCVVKFSLCRSQWHGFAKAAGMVLGLQ